MFQGEAREALDLYGSVFPDFRVEVLEAYGEGEAGAAGLVKMARARLMDLSLTVIDSPVSHAFSFTPSMSLFVEFDDGDAVDAAFARLADGGQVMMPLDDYGFSDRFGWVCDRFGVSWQMSLNLPG